MTHPPDGSYDPNQAGSNSAAGSWPAYGAPQQGGQQQGAPQQGGQQQGGGQPPAAHGGNPGVWGPPTGAPGQWGPSTGAPGNWGSPTGAPGQQYPPGAPASRRTGLRTGHLVLAAILALVLGGAAGFAGGFYGLGGGVTRAQAQEQRDRIAELEQQVSDLEEQVAALEDEADGADGGDGSGGTAGDMSVSIGVPTGWAEIMAASQVWMQALVATGYEVEIVEVPELTTLYTALANGNVDMSFGSWVPSNQSYLDQYGDDLEDLGSWFDDARMGIVVNEDAPITSLAELADHAEEFDGEIIGIEADSGLMQLTTQEAVPAYGLEDLTVRDGTTGEMLQEVAAAMDSGENVAAAFWSPNWALDELPLRFLEDPEGAFGEPESIHAYGRIGFSAEQPELADCLAEISLTTEQVNSMVNTVLSEGSQGDPEAAQQWLADNPDVVCDALA